MSEIIGLNGNVISANGKERGERFKSVKTTFEYIILDGKVCLSWKLIDYYGKTISEVALGIEQLKEFIDDMSDHQDEQDIYEEQKKLGIDPQEVDVLNLPETP